MPEKVLPVLETHTSGAQTPTERVFQVMDAHKEPQRRSCVFPCRCVHGSQRRAFVGEHPNRVLATDPLNNGLGSAIEHDKPIISVFHLLLGNDEYACLKLWNLYFIIPSETTNLFIPASGVHGKKAHHPEMLGKGCEELRLLIPG